MHAHMQSRWPDGPADATSAGEMVKKRRAVRVRVTRWLSFFLSFLSWPITFSVLVLLPQTDTAARKVVGVESRPGEGGEEHG